MSLASSASLASSPPLTLTSPITKGNVVNLRKKFEERDISAFTQLLDIMNRKVNCTEELVAEATYAIFLYSYNFGDLVRGKQAMEILLQRANENYYSKYYSSVLCNASFYLHPLFTVPVHNLKQIHFQNQHNLNPFVVKDTKTGGYMVGARVINLSNNKGSDYDIFVYSSEGTLLHMFPLVYQFTHKRYRRITSFYGAEDIRVIHFPPYSFEGGSKEDKFLAIGTTLDTHIEGETRLSLFHLLVKRNEKNEIVALTATNLIPLKGYEDNKDQKNWLPFFQNEKLYFVYKHDPIVILEAEERVGVGGVKGDFTGIVKKVFQDRTYIASKHRGNTPPIPYPVQVNGKDEERWLYIAHVAETSKKIYYHRFIEFSKEFKLTRISSLFYFEQNNHVEFAIGMIPSTKENEFFISYGVKDKIARVSRVHKSNIEEFFSSRN